MPLPPRLAWVSFVLLGLEAAALRAQHPLEEPPAPLRPAHPLAPPQQNRRQARQLYAQALLQQHDDRILEAIRSLEEARQLDPEAVPIHRALVPLYLAVGRTDDFLAACQKVVAADPDDYETWYLYARQLQELSRPREAREALNRAVACPALAEKPEQHAQMLFELGVAEEEAGNWTAAEGAFRRVVAILERPEALLESGPYSREQITAETAKTWERIGRVCLQARAYDRAEAAFRKAQTIDPGRAGRLFYNLAETCQAQGKHAEALAYLDEYLKTQPPGAEAYQLRCQLLRRLGRALEVIPSLQHWADRDVFNVALQLLLAEELTRERHYAAAEARYQKLLADRPTPEVYRGLFRLYHAQRRMDRVLDMLDGALAAARPGEQPAAAEPAAVRARGMVLVLRDEPALVQALLPEVIAELRREQPRPRAPETRRLLAVLARRAHQLDAAEALLRSCLAQVTPATEAEVYGTLLDVLWEARKYAEIEKLCRDGLAHAQATNRALFQVNLAQALLHLDRPDEAVAEADKAVNLADDRNRLRIRRLKVDVLRQAGRFEQAVAECFALLKEYQQPGEVRDIRYSLASVYSSAKDYARAEQQLRRILEVEPNDISANNDLGYILADQNKNLDEAERLIRKAIELDVQQKKLAKELRPEADPESAHAAYLDSLGWVLFRRGQLREARSWLEKAVRLDGGDDPIIWDHLGDVRYRLQEIDGARAAWQKALELYERDKRRRSDEHYKEVKQKLLELETPRR
ncbi:MAG: tetratricopeptide repeat protein [Gemmataceae bacterium]|nr:tetratricopeptide repeat protein [Gemmataceae bacterium]MDW8267030.1 tetratricopeptide repeat protein [Gemmataceae bacterium]